MRIAQLSKVVRSVYYRVPEHDAGDTVIFRRVAGRMGRPGPPPDEYHLSASRLAQDPAASGA